MEQQPQQSVNLIRVTLNRLQYDLDYLRNRFKEKPCIMTFEYKYWVLSLGLSKLQSMKATITAEFQKEYDSLLAKYNYAFQNTL